MPVDTRHPFFLSVTDIHVSSQSHGFIGHGFRKGGGSKNYPTALLCPGDFTSEERNRKTSLSHILKSTFTLIDVTTVNIWLVHVVLN